MNKKLIKDNFFEAVNGEWLSKHKIPDDKSGTGSFERLDEKLNKLKIKLLNKWSKESNEIQNNPILIELVKFYTMANNWNDRKKHGIKPVLSILDRITSFKSWSDIQDNYSYLTLHNLSAPMPFFVETDFKNYEKQELYISCPNVILPEKKYYLDEQKKISLYNLWKEMVTKLLKKVNKNEQWISNLIEKALKWDTEAAKYILSAEDWAIISKIYNPKQVSEFDEKVTNFKMSKIIGDLLHKNVDRVIAVSDDLIESYSKLITKENFENYQAFLYIDTLLSLAEFLDYDSAVIAGEFSRKLKGQLKPLSKTRLAMKLSADGYYKMAFGKYYGETYFGKANKKNVEHMIQKMISIYEKRLSENNWLSQKTKEKAIFKLSKIGVYVGYPDIIDNFYNDLKVTKYNGYDDFIMNVLNFNAIKNKSKFEEYGKKKNKDLWSMTPAIINAYYNPTSNIIVFPAGILQAPFYSDKQSSSSNYGGIGAVIAHEISHAFDNNGSNFDEVGNMINWWTEEDKKEFDLRAQKMIDLFDGRETEVGKCNGKLTVSENIADAGGVSCALEAAKSEDDFNAKKFYISYATNWRAKYRPEFQKLLLDVDVHAPVILRANVQVQNSDDFYNTFKIKKGDKMYLSPEKRVKIW
ncbi:M13 family peptidase [Metamycoplasma phocicerebrale]|uniref:M13 family peptidase n=1 Tax=Metamycoplasma phocicerebrale TaxID=142649 RepID=A0A3Q9V8W3_9BACT|nr:M13 family metallopeptidase [Metamycoplasma phocicerebrale]AZZ65745.1 M13 family peptidase [Metamycoplasma phocicerebrale]